MTRATAPDQCYVFASEEFISYSFVFAIENGSPARFSFAFYSDIGTPVFLALIN